MVVRFHMVCFILSLPELFCWKQLPAAGNEVDETLWVRKTKTSGLKKIKGSKDCFFMVGLVRPPRCAKSKTAAIRRRFADTLSQLTLQQFVCLVLCLIFINVHMATTLLVLFLPTLIPECPLHALSPRRHQFTSGDRVSSESGSRPRWDRPYEHRWTAACLGVPPTRPGYHTGNVAEFRFTFILLTGCRIAGPVGLLDSASALWQNQHLVLMWNRQLPCHEHELLVHALLVNSWIAKV